MAALSLEAADASTLSPGELQAAANKIKQAQAQGIGLNEEAKNKPIPAVLGRRSSDGLGNGDHEATTATGPSKLAAGEAIDPNSKEKLASLTDHTLAFLKMAVAQNVSDIHLRVGHPPVLRRSGDMHYTRMAPVTEQHLHDFMAQFAQPEILPQLKTAKDLDFSFEVKGVARFRVSWLRLMESPGVVLRIIKSSVPDFETLGLPNSILEFANLNKGLVLVTGPTGSGKTTTLAALINHINRTQSCHIITLEDPVEFVYTNQRSVITQRQLGHDTATFPGGIKYALRQDPDVILVGEMRDRETIEAALQAAETGHLVFSTLHTNDAVQTIERIINQFQPHEREAVRLQIASSLQGTVAQRLVKKVDGRTRMPIVEIMTVTSTVRDYITKGKIDDIYDVLSKSVSEDMISLNRSLFNAYQAGSIDAEEALQTSEQPHELTLMLRGVYNSAGSNFASSSPADE